MRTTQSERSAAIVVSMAALAMSAWAQNAPVVWAAPSLQRVGLHDSAGNSSEAQLYGARSAYDAFQVVVSGSKGLTNVNLTVSDLHGPSVIPASSFTLYREKYVYVNASSPNWGSSNQPLGAGWYADALIPFRDPETGQPLSGATYTAVPCSVARGQNQPFWIDLLIPAGAPAGQYSGTYTLSSDQGNFTGQIALTVWNFAMPASPALKSAFLFWTAGNDASLKELMRHRLMPLSEPPADQPDLMKNFGLSAANAGMYSGASVGNCSMSGAPSTSDFQSAAAAQQPSLMIYDYSADEVGGCPNLFPAIQQWAYNMHQAGIENLVTMAPVPGLFSDGSGTGRSAVDIWTMLPEEYDSSLTYVQQALKKGDSAWSYNTLVQDGYSPKWEIDFDPLNFRLQPGFISQSLGITGLLYWRVDDFTADPWNNPNNAGTFSSNNYPGEGMLFYPGQQVGLNQVVPSMRLKWLRAGVEDYGYVQILKNLGNPAQAMQIANSVAPDWTNWTRDAGAVTSARIQVGEAIDRLSGPVAPAVPASPSPANGATGVPTNSVLSWAASSGAVAYDVYFGPSSPPAYAARVSGASYTPGALRSGTTYYWRVAAKGQTASATSPIWSFTVESAAAPSSPPPAATGPAAVSVSPSPWSGWGHNFTLEYSDPGGYQNLTGGSALINSSLSGVNACWFYYDQGSNAILLASDDTSNWSPMPVSAWGAYSTSTLSNSQCTLWGAWMLGSGTDLNVVVSVSFDASFAGGKTVWMLTSDKSGQSSGYQAKGSWTIIPQSN